MIDLILAKRRLSRSLPLVLDLCKGTVVSCVALTALLGFSSPTVFADPLEDLLQSSEVKRLNSPSAVEDPNVPRDIAKNGEYWRLFSDEEKGPDQLFEWLGEPTPQYNLINRHPLRTADFVGIHAVYQDADKRSYVTQILVPHPRRFFVADAGLIDAFREISDFAFQPDTTDKVPIGKLSGTVLARASGQCLLKVPLERHAWFTVSQSEGCEDPRLLTQFARTMFLDRVNLKLKL